MNVGLTVYINLPHFSDGYGARPKKPGKHWQQGSNNSRLSGPRYLGPQQSWERGQARRPLLRQLRPHPYTQRPSNQHSSFRLQNSMQERPNVGPLGLRPMHARGAGLMPQPHPQPLLRPHHVPVAQPRNMFINPNFKGTMHLPRPAEPAWEQTGYDSHYRQQVGLCLVRMLRKSKE